MSQPTQEQKRVKLAEWAGWAIHNASTMFGRHRDGFHSATIPDYFNSLDAVHLLENTLITTPQLEEEYYFAIKRNHRATAAERAEALFQVISFFK